MVGLSINKLLPCPFAIWIFFGLDAILLNVVTSKSICEIMYILVYLLGQRISNKIVNEYILVGKILCISSTVLYTSNVTIAKGGICV